MKERPILFSGTMIKAILAGTKSQTRREVTRGRSLVNGTGCDAAWWAGLDFASDRVFMDRGPSPDGNPGQYLHVPRLGHRLGELPGLGRVPARYRVHRVYSRIQPGDRLVVREAWRFADWTPHGEPWIEYRADGTRRLHEGATIPDAWHERLVDTWADLSADENRAIDGRSADRRWRPSIHMPRWASRITLEVTSVRVERLHEITEDDARAEGVGRDVYVPPGACAAGDDRMFTYRGGFACLWAEINGAESLRANPYVWVVAFRRVESEAP